MKRLFICSFNVNSAVFNYFQTIIKTKDWNSADYLDFTYKNEFYFEFTYLPYDFLFAGFGPVKSFLCFFIQYLHRDFEAIGHEIGDMAFDIKT